MNTKPIVGQTWKENDNRFKRVVEIISVKKDKVTIKTVFSSVSPLATGKTSEASLHRFNGKSGGYSLQEKIRKVAAKKPNKLVRKKK